MKISANTLCPCHSKKKYKKCCKIFHEGINPKTAEQLMRSRFCAYSLNNAEYIIKTTHQNNQDYSLDINTWKNDISSFCENTDFVRLEILEIIQGDDESYVTFKAILKQDNLDSSFTEKSRFLKVENKWLYIDGIFI
ncbi:MAG: YchJ family protein [Poseidonibacter sp.]